MSSDIFSAHHKIDDSGKGCNGGPGARTGSDRDSHFALPCGNDALGKRRALLASMAPSISQGIHAWIRWHCPPTCFKEHVRRAGAWRGHGAGAGNAYQRGVTCVATGPAVALQCHTCARQVRPRYERSAHPISRNDRYESLHKPW